jgi:hypothetical protein
LPQIGHQLILAKIVGDQHGMDILITEKTQKKTQKDEYRAKGQRNF